MSVKILITGGAGFIGSSLADRLLDDERNDVVLVDDVSTGCLEYLPEHPRCRFIKGDVNDLDDFGPVMTAYRFDYVFHYAAVVGVQRTLDNPVSVLNDIEGIRNVLRLAKSTGVKRVLYASSSEVYGEPVELPQHERTTPLNSRLPYAVVKNVGEAYCRSYHQEYGVDYVVLRFFNTYGPRQSTDFVLSKFLRCALAGEELTIYGDGSQSRTFCYVDDNVDACVAALSQPSARNQVVNIGNDKVTTILELAQAILDVTGSGSKIVHLPPLAEGDMTRRQPDISKMRELLGRPLVTLEEGIQRLLDSPEYSVGP